MMPTITSVPSKPGSGDGGLWTSSARVSGTDETSIGASSRGASTYSTSGAAARLSSSLTGSSTE
jgi:hypothetical protein